MSKSMIIFRPAKQSDADVITDFNCRLASETENLSLDPLVVSRGVQRGLQLIQEVRYFIAEHATTHAVVGQLMLTREWSDWRDGWMIWLQSVYVAADFRGRSVFSGLLDYSLNEIAREWPFVGVRLYVEHHNDRAQNTYRRLGFDAPGYLVMERPATV